jgi:membrane-associated phospholipid phosphatase
MTASYAALLLTVLLFPAPAAAQSPPPRATFIEAAAIDWAAVLPRWPEDASLAGEADLETVLALQAYRSPTQEAEANEDAPRGPVEWAQAVLGSDFTSESYPIAAALLADVHNDMRAVNRAANAVHGLRLRPAERDTRVRPSLANVAGRDNPSYPSARTAGSLVWAHVLAEIFPERRAALFAAAERTAWLRMIGGGHYPSDIVGGRKVGEAAWALLKNDAAFQARLSAARAEAQARGGDRSR